MGLRTVLTGLTLALALLAAVGAAAQESSAGKLVSVLNWSDYIDPGVIDDFSSETGIRVVYDTYDSTRTLLSKLAAAKGGYDVIVEPAPFVQRQGRAGLLQKIDRNKLPNAHDFWPEVVASLAGDEPDAEYALDYLWFTAGIAYNVGMARQRLGGADPQSVLATLDVIFRPELLKAFSGCGVAVIDNPEVLFELALIYLKLSPRPRSGSDLARAAELLSKIRPLVKTAKALELTEALAKGEVCLAVTWAGDAVQARNRARAALKHIDIGYAVPREGTLIALDVLAVPRDALHVAAAYRFIDFLMRPDIAARNTNATGLASGIAAAKPLVEGKLAADPAIYPDPEVMSRLFPVEAFDGWAEQFVSRFWATMKGEQAPPKAAVPAGKQAKAPKPAAKPPRRGGRGPLKQR